MNSRSTVAEVLWWLLLGFVAALFLAVPVGIVGYAAGGAVVGGIGILGTLLICQLPCMLVALRGTNVSFGKPPDEDVKSLGADPKLPGENSFKP